MSEEKPKTKNLAETLNEELLKEAYWQGCHDILTDILERYEKTKKTLENRLNK